MYSSGLEYKTINYDKLYQFFIELSFMIFSLIIKFDC